MTAAPMLDSIMASWPSKPQGSLPAWFADRQRRALDAARASTWPSQRDEAWKYTSLQAVGQASADSTVAHAAQNPHTAPQVRGLVFVDGGLVPMKPVNFPEGVTLTPLSVALREDAHALRFAIGHESEEGDIFDHLNVAFADDGAWLRVADGVDAGEWLTLRCEGSECSHWHVSHRIEVGERACLRLCVDLAHACESRGLATVFTRIRVQRGGRLELAWLAGRGDVAAIARTRIELERDAELVFHVLDAGAAPSRHDLHIALRGENARAHLGGVFSLDGKAHADTQLDLRHEAPNTASKTVWRAIASGRSRGVFNGGIVVQPGADGTDAQLACKSLLLSAQAEIDVKPVLEIYADDVKCTHGATVGQLDELALFYLRSRGLDEASARALLTRAFVGEALAGIADSPVLAALDHRLHGIAA